MGALHPGTGRPSLAGGCTSFAITTISIWVRALFPLTRRGCFVRRGMTTYRLDTQSFALLDAIDTFNALPVETKTRPEAFLRFATVKGLAEGMGAQLNRYLAEERVLVPSRIGLDLLVEEHGHISFAPKIDGVAPDAIRQAFFALDDVDTVYALDDPGGGRLRVVLDDQQREVLRRMQRVRHLSGPERTGVLRGAQAVFDGVAKAIDIDPTTFGPRVLGVGDSLRDATLSAPAQRGLRCPGRPRGAVSWRHVRGGAHLSLCRWQQCRRPPDLTRRDAHLASAGTGGVAARDGNGGFPRQIAPRRCPVDPALDELLTAVLPPPAPRQETATPTGRYLLIYRNEDQLEYTEDVAHTSPGASLTLPQALKPDVVLKDHQRLGVAWLSATSRWAGEAVSWRMTWAWERPSRSSRSWPD